MVLETKDMTDKVWRFDFFTKQSGPSVQWLLDKGIQVYYTWQRDGDVVLTLAGCLHAVYNFGVGFATARNFIQDASIELLHEELEMVRSSARLRDMFIKAKQFKFMESLPGTRCCMRNTGSMHCG